MGYPLEKLVSTLQAMALKPSPSPNTGVPAPSRALRGILGCVLGQRGPFCVFLLGGGGSAEHGSVSSVRHCASTASSQIFPMPKFFHLGCGTGSRLQAPPVPASAPRPWSTLPWEEELTAPAANPTAAQVHSTPCAKAWGEYFCFGLVYVLEVAIPK